MDQAALQIPDSPEPRAHATPEVYGYLFILCFLVLSPGGVIYTPIQFIYKDQLHLTADQTAIFKLIVNVPGYLAFVFGILRDRFNPFRMGDRGFLLIFGLASAAILSAMSQMPLTRWTVGLGLIIWSLATGMIGAAFQAILRNVADSRMMSGRVSTVLHTMGAGVGAVALLGGGWLVDHASWREQIGLVSGLCLCIALLGLWKAPSVFEAAGSARSTNFAKLWSEAKQLRHYRAYWIAVVIWTVWNFTPPGGTPMQYYLRDVLKVSGTQYGSYTALLAVAFLPTALLFGPLCKRYRLWPLMLVATAFAIPQWVPVIFVKNMNQVYAGAIVIGLAGGFGNAAYYAILLRACPRALAGSGMLVASGLCLVGIELGNVLGGYLYRIGGFPICAIVTTATYALLLPLCFLVPRRLVTPRDDEYVPTEEELVAA
jgi:MFS family permease